jgi:hypothetical protein
MHCRTMLSAGVVFLLAASSAWAGNRGIKDRTAKKACLLGDYKKGIEILANLYLDTNDPTYIYNQGRCLEQNGQNAQAFLRVPRIAAVAVTRLVEWMPSRMVGRRVTVLLTSLRMFWFPHLTVAQMWSMVEKILALVGRAAVVMVGYQTPLVVSPMFQSAALEAVSPQADQGVVAVAGVTQARAPASTAEQIAAGAAAAPTSLRMPRRFPRMHRSCPLALRV